MRTFQIAVLVGIMITLPSAAWAHDAGSNETESLQNCASESWKLRARDASAARNPEVLESYRQLLWGAKFGWDKDDHSFERKAFSVRTSDFKTPSGVLTPEDLRKLAIEEAIEGATLLRNICHNSLRKQNRQLAEFFAEASRIQGIEIFCLSADPTRAERNKESECTAVPAPRMSGSNN